MSTDLTQIRGDTGTYTLTLVDEAGDPFDLTGADVFFTVGDSFTKTVGDGLTVADPLTGVVEIVVVPADTEDFADTRTATPYAVRLELADDTTRTPMRGRFIVLPVPEPVTT